ncbi:hypothetical protein ACXAT3_002729 [Clostridium sporogenes]
MNNINAENMNTIKGNGYEIYADEINRIRIKVNNPGETPEVLTKATELVKIVNRIDSLPLNNEERKRYQKDIANIYQIGLLSDISLAKQYADDLKQEIENNLTIRKKQILFIPVVGGFILLILIGYVSQKNNIIGEVGYPIIYGSIGGLLSVIFQNNKLDIDYYVIDRLLYFEAFKLVLLSNIMAIVGSLAIKSEVILANINNVGNGVYIEFLIYVLCGYSQTFIPNILKNFELTNVNNDDSKKKKN